MPDLFRTSPTNLGYLRKLESAPFGYPPIERVPALRAFLDDVCGERSTDFMTAGQHLHNWLEWTAVGTPIPAAAPPIEWRCEPRILKPHLVETRRTRDTELLDGRTVRLSGRIDAISGLTGVEYKGTGWIRWATYMESPQWRCYLYLFPELEAIRYDVFVWDAREWEKRSRLIIKDHDKAVFHRYPELETDVRAMLARWVEIADRLLDRGIVGLDDDGRMIYRGPSIIHRPRPSDLKGV